MTCIANIINGIKYQVLSIGFWFAHEYLHATRTAPLTTKDVIHDHFHLEFSRCVLSDASPDDVTSDDVITNPVVSSSADVVSMAVSCWSRQSLQVSRGAFQLHGVQ